MTDMARTVRQVTWRDLGRERREGVIGDHDRGNLRMPTPRLTAPRRSGLIWSLGVGGSSLVGWGMVALATSGALVWQPSTDTSELLINLASTITCVAVFGGGLWWLALRMMRGQHRIAGTVDQLAEQLANTTNLVELLGGSTQAELGQLATIRAAIRARNAAVSGALHEIADAIPDLREREWAAGYEARDADVNGTDRGQAADTLTTTVRQIRPRTNTNHQN